MATREEVEAAAVAAALRAVDGWSDEDISGIAPHTVDTLDNRLKVDVSIDIDSPMHGENPSVLAAFDGMMRLPPETRERLLRFATLCNGTQQASGTPSGSLAAGRPIGAVMFDLNGRLYTSDAMAAAFSTTRTRAMVRSDGSVTFEAIPAVPANPPPRLNVWERLVMDDE